MALFMKINRGFGK